MKALQDAIDFHRQGRLDEAERAYQDFLDQHPENGEALHYLGVVSLQKGEPERGVTLMERAVAIDPENAGLHNNLGNALAALKRHQEAVAAFGRSIELQDNSAAAYSNLSAALHALRQLNQAQEAASRAVGLDPALADARFNLANALRDLGRAGEAHPHAVEAVKLGSGRADHLALVASILKDMENWTDSFPLFEKALAAAPDSADILSNHANALCDIGRIEESESQNRRAMKLRPQSAEIHSNLLFIMNYRADHGPADLWRQAGQWNDSHAAALTLAAAPHPNSPEPLRPLRIGYVSGDLRHHSVGYFMAAVLTQHAANGLQAICYSNTAREDQLSDQLRRSAAQWRNILGVGDEAVAAMIRADRIDILVDLAGHSGNNRLLVFARRPAPVQVAYLGYPATTGLSAMDYRITDEICDPADEKGSFYAESLVRLPHGFLCYTPPPEAPAVAPLPALGEGRITFGSFNNLSKITPGVVETWSALLGKVGGARLILKNKPLGDASVSKRYAAMFAGFGIGPDRLEFLGNIASTAGHLDLYGKVDIALDPFPYNGTTTTCEAAWMGVPTICLAGDRHAARVGASLANTLNLTDLVAADVNSYVDLTATLGSDLERLGQIRAGLRGRVRQSALMDGGRVVASLEAAYGDMWKKWCAGAEKGA